MADVITHTVEPGGGGDYSSLDAWEAAQARNLVTDDEIARAVCGAGTDTTAVTFDGGWTTDGLDEGAGDRFIHIVADTGDEAKSPWDASGAYILQATSQLIDATSSDHHILIEGLQFDCTGSAVNNVMMHAANNGNVLFRRCYMWYSVADADNRWFTRLGDWHDCILESAGNQSTILECQAGGEYFNLTLYAPDGHPTNGFLRRFNGAPEVRNTVVWYENSDVCWASGWSGNDSNCSFNAAKDTTSPGSSAVDSISDPFVSTSDFHLAASSDLENVGTTVSGKAAEDFDEVSRPQGASWDIGAFERVAAAAAFTPQIINMS